MSEEVERYLTNRMDAAHNGLGRASPRSITIDRSVAANWRAIPERRG